MKRSMAALVIGNGNYPDGHSLHNPTNDAADLSAKLKGYGFTVIEAIDCKVAAMDKALKAFRKLLTTHEVGLFFFAGHGIQIEGGNYLLALDTDLETETDAKHSALALDKVVEVMATSEVTTKIIILDACRNNPWKRAWARGHAVRGLASVYAPKGTIIGFATSPGELASDGAGRNGAYTDALLQHIDTPDCSIETMFKRVRNTVAAATEGKQTSWEHTSLSGEFHFNMSLGKLIDEYDNTALADSLFVPDPGRRSHRVITELKRYNWYKQAPAIEMLEAGAVNKMPKNSLFVIGRNIYQAAVGNSGAAQNFIENFIKVTAGVAVEKRKALLDGMLFEIFFDPEGKLREEIKGRCFNTVFELQKFAPLKDSFAFIADALTVAGGNFYAVPGKGQEVAVTVSTKKKKAAITIDAIYLGGVDILRLREDAQDRIGRADRETEIEPEWFVERLSQELVVPVRCLKISYTPAAAGAVQEFRMPRFWTVRKG